MLTHFSVADSLSAHAYSVFTTHIANTEQGLFQLSLATVSAHGILCHSRLVPDKCNSFFLRLSPAAELAKRLTFNELSPQSAFHPSNEFRFRFRSTRKMFTQHRNEDNLFTIRYRNEFTGTHVFRLANYSITNAHTKQKTPSEWTSADM